MALGYSRERFTLRLWTWWRRAKEHPGRELRRILKPRVDATLVSTGSTPNGFRLSDIYFEIRKTETAE
jgi:hypothetical protein